MAVQTVRLAGKDYTLIPSREFRHIARELAHYRAETASDLTVARRRLKDSKDKPIPWEQAKKRLGSV